MDGPPKISQPPLPENFSTPPPVNFSTPPKISQPLRKFLNPPESFSTPQKISQPHSKKSQPPKYVNNYLPPPPPIHFYLFFFFLPRFSLTFKKNLKISEGRFEPPPPHFKYALDDTGYLRDMHDTGYILLTVSNGKLIHVY